MIPGAQIGAHFTITSTDRVLRYSVGTALGVIAVIYAVGEIIARRCRSTSVDHP